MAHRHSGVDPPLRLKAHSLPALWQEMEGQQHPDTTETDALILSQNTTDYTLPTPAALCLILLQLRLKSAHVLSILLPNFPFLETIQLLES